MSSARTVRISLHYGQRQVWNSDARFKVLAAGRRWGKTFLGSAMCMDVGLRGGRAWWVAPSYPMSIVGWRGLAELRMQLAPYVNIKAHKVARTLTFPNGGEVRVKSADRPDSLRGESLNLVVLDECAFTKEEAWTHALRPALSDRLGSALFISTPHGLNWFRKLWIRGQDPLFPEWDSWTFKTSDNPYISPDEIELARRGMLSRIFRQEYEADFLEDNPGALWKRAWIDENRVLEAPDLARIVVAVDPSASADGDECGIVCGGMTRLHGEPHLYVLEDASRQGTPDEWARTVVTLYRKYSADSIVAEANNGGEMVSHTIQTVDRTARVKLVHASRGKHTRAEPISAIYEQNRGHHVGNFVQLEDEMVQWEPGLASPNRMDALVWLGTELIKPKGVFVG